MRTRKQDIHRGCRVLLGLGLAGLLATANAADGPRFGRTATSAEISAVDIDVKPDGASLPAGSGTADAGAKTFAMQCAACHGNSGVEGPRDRLVGGVGSLATSAPLKTVGSYWQYAPTLYDYINRAMPFTAPGTLKPDEVYSLVAFLLSRNGVISETAVMDRTSLPQVKMPNRDGFIDQPEYRSVKR
jgi:S-disulfanyl-L-cysteine oxidoreductase SoxD